jgi:hypothetical protein
MRFILLLALFWVFFFEKMPAQTVVVSEGLSLRNDYGYEIVGRYRDRILLYRDRYDNFEIQAFDGQMRPTWNRELENLERRGTQVLSVIAGKNDFSIIYRYRKRASTYLRINKYDPAANLIDTMTVMNYGERVFSPPELDIARSDDRNCFVVYNTADRSKVEAVCFRLDKMEVLWNKVALYEQDFVESALKSVAVSNDGHFFITSEYDNRKTRIESHRLHVLRIGPEPDQVRYVRMPKFLTADFKTVFDNQHRRLVIAGLCAEKNRDRTNGSFFVRMEPNDTTSQVFFTEFDEQFVSVLRRKEVDEDNRGVSDADVAQLILRQDGGVLIVAERHYEINRGSVGGGRGFIRDGARLIIDYYFDDLFVVAHQPDGKVHWRTVLHKKQYSQDDEATFSSYFLMRNVDRLHFLFNDEIKYENTCSDYVVSPAGAFDRNSLFNTFGQNLRLRFRDGLQVSANECIIPSEFRNKLRLALVRY